MHSLQQHVMHNTKAEVINVIFLRYHKMEFWIPECVEIMARCHENNAEMKCLHFAHKLLNNP